MIEGDEPIGRRTPAVASLAATWLLGGLLGACQNPGATAGAPGDTTHGKLVFITTCSTCHGQDGSGVKGLGKDLVQSEFVKKTADDDLVKMVNIGRPADHPLNTNKIAMPPKGGNSALTDQDVRDAIAYLRTISKPS